MFRQIEDVAREFNCTQSSIENTIASMGYIVPSTGVIGPDLYDRIAELYARIPEPEPTAPVAQAEAKLENIYKCKMDPNYGT